MADAVLGQIFDWIYGKLAGFFSDFFEMMNMMGAELFDLPWTQAVVLFFSRFAWVLYAVGLVVAGFEYAIQSQSGRGDLHGLALNGIKGFMAVSLFTTVPVELYRLCVTLQGTFASGLAQLMGGEDGSIGSCSLRTSGAAASCSSRSPWAACTFSACRADTWTGSGTGENRWPGCA